MEVMGSKVILADYRGVGPPDPSPGSTTEYLLLKSFNLQEHCSAIVHVGEVL